MSRREANAPDHLPCPVPRPVTATVGRMPASYASGRHSRPGSCTTHDWLCNAGSSCTLLWPSVSLCIVGDGSDDRGVDDGSSCCAISVSAWLHLSLQTCCSQHTEEKLKARGHHQTEVAVMWTESKLQFRPSGRWSCLILPEKGTAPPSNRCLAINNS